jgi:putative ABC transport system ATP-binding protein
VSSEPIIRSRALNKTYRTASGDIEALRSVDAEFAAGEVTAIMGASGSGKSTFLRAIAGLDRPTHGDLHVAGRNLTTATGAALRRHRKLAVTYVSQKPADNFIPHLTVGQHAHDTAGSAYKLLAEVGIEHRLGSTPIELSGGEQACAAFALALARATPLIVIDEPTAELDRRSAAPLLQAIRRHAGAGTAFVIATHDPDVTAIADSILRLDRGRVITGPAQPTTEHVRRRHPTQFVVPTLEARAVSKAFTRGHETIRALSNVTLALGPGDLGVLLGRSGSGKSTLLTLLASWQKPDDGEILRTGTPTHAAPDWAQLGYLPQRFGLLDELTIRDNVELPARLTDRRAELSARLEHLLHKLGLDELADRRPPETSIGQQQRTALARALLLSPALLIADEPTSHQDAGWRDAVWQQIAQAAANGTTCLIATHEPQAGNYATRLWNIDAGIIRPIDADP